jgi:uncharacterized protein (DUF924 family)
MSIKVSEIIEYWYSDRLKSQWFSATPELDQEILDHYEVVWEQALAGELDFWCENPEGCLALIIVLDQFPLNMFRNQQKSFKSEQKALEIALHAIKKGFPQQLDASKNTFLFMPLMHSEDLVHQEKSVTLFSQYCGQDNARFAKHHRDIVKKFGRFPHRNKILGRESSTEEIAYLASDKAFTG